MSDRKYRQRGYQDDNRDRQPRPSTPRPAPEPGAPAGTRRLSSQDGPKNINMPGYREVVRCAQCGAVVAGEVARDAQCLRCGAELHSCSQCTSFDPGSRFECMQPTLTARIAAKKTRNTCTLYTARTTVERETTTPRVDDARKAFDDLFK
jgi:hypothetical protein